jgi:hypothetical protein
VAPPRLCSAFQSIRATLSPGDKRSSIIAVTNVIAGADRPILELGGPTAVARSYADLTTSIINPKHVISERYRDQLLLNAEIPRESPMPTPNLDTMSVRQLIDIVAFLDSRYQLMIEDYE